MEKIVTFQDLRQRIVTRLEEGDRGDRGWFIITRVHVALAWLQGIAEYLEDRGGGTSIRLTPQDYLRLAAVTGSDNADPGVQLRRHHLLVMDKPLRLLGRLNEPYWDAVSLTERGRELAHTNDPAAVLEGCLAAIQFAAEPWTPPDRVTEYAAFDVPVYHVTRSVLAGCDGHIDRDECDLFLSRVRSIDEIGWAVEGVHAYRELATAQQRALLNEVRTRIPSVKTYQNWRDVALHTFSLFALGTSMVRDQQQLLLTGTWAEAHASPRAERRERMPELRFPQSPEVEELLAPPTAPASNVGSEGESFVAKVLRSQGWEVAFYTNRRGYGFDLWARRGRVAMVAEVKSSLGLLGNVNLTELEYRAAAKYGDNYVLALVEQMSGNTPRLRLIQNPLAKMRLQRQEVASYVVTRAEWRRAADAED